MLHLMRYVNASLVVTLICFLGSPAGHAQNAYITNSQAPNFQADTVSVIDTRSNSVIATIPVGVDPEGVAVGPDGSAVYVTNFSSNTVSVIAGAANSVIATIPVDVNPVGVAVTPDGHAVYVANNGSSTVSVIATSSNAVTATIPVSGFPEGVVVSPDGSAVYIASFGSGGGNVSVIAAATNEVTATIPVGGAPFGIAITPDGRAVYVANNETVIGPGGDDVFVINTASNSVIATIPVGRLPKGVAISPDGSTVYVTNTVDSTVSVIATASNKVTATIPVGMQTVSNQPNVPLGVAVTPDGAAVYVAIENNDAVSVISTASNTVTATIPVGISPQAFGKFIQSAAPSPLLAAVLPASRSVQVNATATAFATIINAGTVAASSCAIAPLGGLPLNFLYQTTDPATNALTGSANTPVNIAAGAAQSFVIALTPTAAFAATNVDFSFACANAAAAPMQTGLNTLLLSGSTSPVPDIVALAASADPGIVDIPGTNATGAFAVATVNLGADATITASANTGAATLPVTLVICQTVPATGACMASPAASVSTDIRPNATPTFGIFVTSSGNVPFDPANSRVFVSFADSGGTVRGSTSVAVRTQ